MGAGHNSLPLSSSMWFVLVNGMLVYITQAVVTSAYSIGQVKVIPELAHGS